MKKNSNLIILLLFLGYLLIAATTAEMINVFKFNTKSMWGYLFVFPAYFSLFAFMGQNVFVIITVSICFVLSLIFYSIYSKTAISENMITAFSAIPLGIIYFLVSNAFLSFLIIWFNFDIVIAAIAAIVHLIFYPLHYFLVAIHIETKVDSELAYIIERVVLFVGIILTIMLSDWDEENVG